MKETREFLKSIGLPEGDRYDLPDSEKRFPDGGQYRFEVPGIQNPSSMKALLEQIMGTVVYEGVGVAPLPANVGEKTVTQLDTRYLWLGGSCVLAIIALSAIIIVAIRYRHSKEEEPDEQDDDTTVDVAYVPKKTGLLRMTAEDEVEKPKKDEKKGRKGRYI